MPHKKVLLATRPLVPPWDEASKNFAYFLGRSIENHSLTLLTTRQGVGGLPPLAEEKAIYDSSYFGPFEKLTLLNYLRTVRHQFDVTHYLFTPTWLNTLLIRLLAHPTRGKTLQTVATLRDDLYSAGQLKGLFFADHVVVYTEATKEKVQALGKQAVTRIYPGIDLVKFSPQPKFHALLESFGFGEGHFIVMYPGEYTRLGATDMLTTTFVRFFQEHPETPIRFLFACRVKNPSDARKKAWVQKQFEKAGVAHYVRFTDTIADMPSLYNLADLIIFPVSDLKGKFDVPLVIVEAYACSKPVILSDLPEFREFTGPEFSVTIPRASGDALIRAIDALLRDGQARIALGAQARSFVEANFDVRRTAEAYGALYDSL